jgi:hypothetical protein
MLRCSPSLDGRVAEITLGIKLEHGDFGGAAEISIADFAVLIGDVSSSLGPDWAMLLRYPILDFTAD